MVSHLQRDIVCHWSNIPITLRSLRSWELAKVERIPLWNFLPLLLSRRAIALYAIAVKQWFVTVVFWYSCHGVGSQQLFLLACRDTRTREMISLVFPASVTSIVDTSPPSFISAKQFRVSILNKSVLGGVDREAMLTHFSNNRPTDFQRCFLTCVYI